MKEDGSLNVRVLLSDENYTDMLFPTMPSAGDAIFIPVDRHTYETWIVDKVGFRFSDLTKEGMAVVEASLFEADEAPSGKYDRMLIGR